MNMMTSFNKNYTPSRSYIQDYADIFLKEAAGVLPTHADHDYTIKFASDSNPAYRPIYNLSEPELAVL